MPDHSKPYGLRDVKITPEGGSAVDLPAAQTLSFTLPISSDSLPGDDVKVAMISMITHIEGSIESGGVPLAVIGAMTDNTVSDSGSTPNEVSTLTISAGDNLPYFKIEGQSLADADDDVHVVIFKAKLSSLEGSFGQEEFYISNCSWMAIDDGTNGIIDIIVNETAAAIS